MKKSYSLFLGIGLVLALMFTVSPAFSRSDQDIGNTTEIVSPTVGDMIPASPILYVTLTAAAVDLSPESGSYNLVQEVNATVNDNGVLLVERQRYKCRTITKVVIPHLVNLSLPPPFTQRE